MAASQWTSAGSILSPGESRAWSGGHVVGSAVLAATGTPCRRSALTVLPVTWREDSLLTEAMRREFDDRGLLRLPAAISADRAVWMRDWLWRHLRRTHGARPD